MTEAKSSSRSRALLECHARGIHAACAWVAWVFEVDYANTFAAWKACYPSVGLVYGRDRRSSTNFYAESSIKV